MNSRHWTLDQLDLYVSNMLSSEDSTQLEEHASQCPVCANALARAAQHELAIIEVAEACARKRVHSASVSRSVRSTVTHTAARWGASLAGCAAAACLLAWVVNGARGATHDTSRSDETRMESVRIDADASDGAMSGPTLAQRSLDAELTQ